MKRILMLALAGLLGTAPFASGTIKRPNVILIMADDLGYNDLSCYGSTRLKTPVLDRMAAEGMRLTSFYTGASVCSPSRMALLSGSYPTRVGWEGGVMGYGMKKYTGLPLDVVTIAETFKAGGYRTAMSGKWHLGIQDLLPMNQGFDSAYYITMSNNQTQTLFRDGKLLVEKFDNKRFTETFTEEAIRVITEKSDRPFFIYIPYTAPHFPAQAHPDWKGHSSNKAYGDVVEEMDHRIGEILATLKKEGLDDKTIVVFLSDNGPEGGQRKFASALPFSGRKWTAREGGTRVPCIVRWPGFVPPGKVSDEIVAAIDLYPTLARACGLKIEIPEGGQKLDGVDVWDTLLGRDARHPRNDLLYWHGWAEASAIRQGEWKLFFGADNRGDKTILEGPALYHLKEDPAESKNVAADHPEKVKELLALARTQLEEIHANPVHKAAWKAEADKVKDWKPQKKWGLWLTEASSSPPNVLLITADDMNYDSVGAFGCNVPGITPNLDRLAAGGLKFAHAHVNIAVCQPVRQSMMTGRYPHRNGAEGFEPIDADVPTLQESLRAGGFLNGILGKEAHLKPMDRFCWDYCITQSDLASGAGMGRSVEKYRKHTKTFIERAKTEGKPFFLMANAHDPHRPFAGSEWEQRAWGHDLPKVTRVFSEEEITVPKFLPDVPGVRKEVAQYYTSVFRCDQVVGAVLEALKESGQEENTLVMFLSDHGMPLPFAKANCYLNSTKTPWIVSWPGKVRPGTVDTEHLVSTIDFMPTVLDVLGLKEVEGMDGLSLLPLLRGERQPGRRYAFTEFHQTHARRRFPMRAVQSQRFTYIVNFWANRTKPMRMDSTGGLTFRAMQEAGKTDSAVAARVALFEHRVPEEFFDAEKDPDGLKNLIDDPAYRAEIDKLRSALEKRMKKTGDPALEAFRNREDPAAFDQFMEQQNERAKRKKR